MRSRVLRGLTKSLGRGAYHRNSVSRSGLHVRTNGSVRGARASASEQNLGFLLPVWLTSIVQWRASGFPKAPVATYRCVASISLLAEQVVGIACTRGHVAQKPLIRCWLLSRGG